MKLLPLLLLAPAFAHASWFDFEAGLGASHSRDVGDGVWQQQGVLQNHEQLNAPAYVLGITGDITPHLAWHADYMYSGDIKASCLCVGDEHYNSHTHTASAPGTIPFNGHGHTQGVFFTLEPNYTFSNGVRVGFEAGPVLYWATWHETRFDPQYPNETNLSHRTQLGLGGVAGLSAGRGNWRVAYRYFYMRQQWNPFPALQRGVHMVTYEWRFK